MDYLIVLCIAQKSSGCRLRLAQDTKSSGYQDACSAGKNDTCHAVLVREAFLNGGSGQVSSATESSFAATAACMV